MIAFIDDHRQAYGVEPICRVLPIAPSTYQAHAGKRADPSRLPERVRRDADLKVEIRRVFEENFRVYGVRKGLAAIAAGGLLRRALYGGPADAEHGPSGGDPGQAFADNSQRQGGPLSARSCEPTVPGSGAGSALARGFYLRLDVGRLHLCRLRNRRLCAADRRLASQ